MFMLPTVYQNYFASCHTYDASQIGIKLYVCALCSSHQISAARQIQARKGGLLAGAANF